MGDRRAHSGSSVGSSGENASTFAPQGIPHVTYRTEAVTSVGAEERVLQQKGKALLILPGGRSPATHTSLPVPGTPSFAHQLPLKDQAHMVGLRRCFAGKGRPPGTAGEQPPQDPAPWSAACTPAELTCRLCPGRGGPGGGHGGRGGSGVSRWGCDRAGLSPSAPQHTRVCRQGLALPIRKPQGAGVLLLHSLPWRLCCTQCSSPSRNVQLFSYFVSFQTSTCSFCSKVGVLFGLKRTTYTAVT